LSRHLRYIYLFIYVVTSCVLTPSGLLGDCRRYARANVIILLPLPTRRHGVISSRNASKTSISEASPLFRYSSAMKTAVHRTVILPVVLYGCKTWSIALWEAEGRERSIRGG
jgi:hypothetical protein